jgi:hypothetical protein
MPCKLSRVTRRLAGRPELIADKFAKIADRL